MNRICISINNKCNMACEYCHFRQKEDYIEEKNMNVLKILDNVKEAINKGGVSALPFKIGFVGNGEPLLSLDELTKYILYIQDYIKNGFVSAYTITNGTIMTDEIARFLDKYLTVGISLDGPKVVHDKYRVFRNDKGTFDIVIRNLEIFKFATGHYPTFNPTVGKFSILYTDEIIEFFKQFNSKITFSRMIGDELGITLNEYREFCEKAEKAGLKIRHGSDDCTMYGGQCGAGENNFFFANGNVYLCGNCLENPICSAYEQLNFIEEKSKMLISNFDRNNCFKEENKKVEIK